MKHLISTALACLALLPLASCLGDEPDNGSDWKQENDIWFQSKIDEKDADGNPVYRRIGCSWDPNASVLMKWHNDQAETAGKLTPLSNSTIDVKYEVHNMDNEMIDNSFSQVKPAPGVFRTVLNKNIDGWIVGISNMHIGDTCTIIVPYNLAYGSIAYNGLKPYTSLIFNVRLVDIPAYEKK